MKSQPARLVRLPRMVPRPTPRRWRGDEEDLTLRREREREKKGEEKKKFSPIPPKRCCNDHCVGVLRNSHGDHRDGLHYIGVTFLSLEALYHFDGWSCAMCIGRLAWWKGGCQCQLIFVLNGHRAMGSI
jgi:hypothetical protein